MSTKTSSVSPEEPTKSPENTSIEKKKFYIKIFKKLSYISREAHKGKIITLSILCIIILAGLIIGYHIDGSYIDSKDDPKISPFWDRFFTLIVFIVCYLITGIIGIIIGMESYKTFLERDRRNSLKSLAEHVKIIIDKRNDSKNPEHIQTIQSDIKQILNKLNKLSNEEVYDTDYRLSELSDLDKRLKNLENEVNNITINPELNYMKS